LVKVILIIFNQDADCVKLFRLSLTKTLIASGYFDYL